MTEGVAETLRKVPAHRGVHVQGGAKYLPTGRGLPTERRPFIGAGGGLYNDYAMLAFYDGARLLGALILVILAEWEFRHKQTIQLLDPALVLPRSQIFHGVVVATSISWLFSPLIFNPYQFASKHFPSDIRNWCSFFFADGGGAWDQWYTKTRLQAGSGLKVSGVDFVSWAIPLSATLLILCLHYSGNWIGLIPPCASLALCLFVSLLTDQIKLVPFAFVVLMVDIMEISLKACLWEPRHCVTTWITCLLVQYLGLSLLLAWCECTFRSITGKCISLLCYVKPWLYAHMMLQDMVLSAFILTLTIPFIVFDFCRGRCCKCSLHNILVYRDPGTVFQSQEIGLDGDDMDGSFLRTSFRNSTPQTGTTRNVEMVRTSAAV